MKKKIRTWQLVVNSLKGNVDVVLMYVLESKGSSPGRQGFFMVVNASGEMSGTLGGGIMEHKFVELARTHLKNTGGEAALYKQVHSKSAIKNQSGMICSGEQTIFLYKVQQKDAEHISNMIASMQQNGNGTFHLNQQGILFSSSAPSFEFYFKLNSETDFLYLEKTGYKNELYIIGAGHCSLSFSQLISQMDFRTYLFDDRPGLNTFEQNDFVHYKTIVDDYSKLSEIIPSGNNVYVVIMTYGYRTDRIALNALLDKEFKYIGLLGSKSKIIEMFADFKKNGATEEKLQKIHAPVGIQIHSQTPEEIAVSIAAEIIQIKNNPD